MAVEKFTGELDPVDGPSVTLFKGELDPVSEPSVSLFKGKLDDPTAKPEPKVEAVRPEPVVAAPVPTPKPVPAPIVEEAKPTPAATAPVSAPSQAPTSELAPEFYYDPMTGAPVGNVSSATPQKQPKLPGSVMAGINENLPPAQAPQFDPQVKTFYDAASQQERLKLAQADIRFAEVAKYYQDIDSKNQQYLATNPSRVADPYMADDRLEYRVRDYVQQGMSPEVALNTAKQDALEGRSSHVSTTGEVKEAPEDYLLKRSYALDPKAPGYETALKLAQRTALKSMYGFAQAGGGQQKFLAEAILGVDPSDTNKTLDYISKNTQALGDPTSKPLALVENAVSSIVQQLPGLLTGTQALSLGSMFLQSFGQTYDDSRRKNLGIGESTFRSTAYGALEVLGEKLGLGDTLKGIKAAARGVPDKELIEHFAKSLAKEIPGEQLTYTGQFGVDKAFALNPEAGIKQFLDGAVDTLAATVVQGGIMMGGAAAINKANQTYSDAAGTRRAETAAEAAKQNALQKAQDMFKFTPKQKAETTEQLTPEQTTPSDQETPEFNETSYFDSPEYQALDAEYEKYQAQWHALLKQRESIPEKSPAWSAAITASNKFYDDNIEPLRKQKEAFQENWLKNQPTPKQTKEVKPLSDQDVIWLDQTATEQPAPPEVPTAEPVNYIDTETGEIIPSDQADPQIQYINQETGEVIPPIRVEPVMEGGGNDAVIQRRADELSRDLGLPKNIALSVAQREATERGQNVERTPAKAVTGRIEPSLSVSEQGTATTEGAAPSDTTGLARPVEDTESPVGREEAEPTALSDIPTLTERPPAATYAELAPDDKAGVLQEAQSMWESGEANLPMAKAWNSLPSWKRDMFAQEVYANYDEMTNNGEVFRAAMDKVIEAKKPEEAKPAAAPVAEPSKTQAEINQERQAAQKAAAAPIDTTIDWDFINKEIAKIKRKVANAERVERRAEIGPASKAAKEKLAKALEEGRNFYAKWNPIIEADREARAAKTETPAAETLAAETPAAELTPEQKLYVDLDANRGDPNVQAEVLSNYMANGSHVKNTLRGIINTYLTEGIAKGREKFQAELRGTDTDFSLDRLGLSEEESQQYFNEADEFITGKVKPYAAAETPAATTTTAEAPKRGRGRPPKAKVEGAEPAAPKPKGRPKVELSDEEKAARAEARKKVQGELIKAQRAVDRAIAKLEEKVDVDRFDTPAAFETATDILRQERTQAIYVLTAVADNPMFRKVESSGIKAKQFLASDAITLQERANIAERLKFEETRNKRKAQAVPDSRFTKLGPSGVNTKINRGLYKFSNAADAAAYIAKSGTVFERALARRLMPFLTGVNLVIADTEENTIESAKEVLGKDSAAYFADDFFGEPYKMIVLRGENYGGTAAHGVNNVTFLHEALHAALAAKIDQAMRLVKAGKVKEVPANLRALINDLYGIMNRAQDNYDALKASGEPISEQLQSLFDGIKIGTNIDEFLSYGMTDVELQKFLLGTPALDARDRSIIDRVKNLFTKFVETLRRAFDLGANHQSAFQDLIFATEGLLIEEEYAPADVEKLRLAAKNANTSTAKADKNLTKIAASNNQQDVKDGIQSNVAAHDFGTYDTLMKARLPAMGNGFVSKSLFAMQTSDIIRWQGDNIPALKRVDELVERMAGSRLSMEKAFAKKADKLARFTRYARKSSRQALSDAMHLARLESVSPTEFADRQDALANDARVVELTKLLNDPRTNPDELNAITGKKNAREASINKVFDAWERLGNIKDGQGMYRMVRTFYKDMNVLHRTLLDARIDRLNLSGAVNDPTTPKGKLMMSVRRMFEGSDFAGIDEYFPFMRHGEYWLRVNGPEGREFYMFDNGTDRNKFLNIRAAQIGIDPNDPKAFDAGDNTRALRDKYSGESKILGEMFDVINQHFANTNIPNAANMSADELVAAQKTQAAALEQLKDSLYQTYLMTMPEQSYRKQFLHADNVTGFSSDVFRNFKVSATKMASQSAKLAYGDLINAEVQSGYDSLEGMPAILRSKMRLFVDEISSRAEGEINPQPDNIYATGLNQLGYFWMLSGVATAITQTTSIPIMVMPILNDEYGYGKSAAKFTKYMQLWKSVGVTDNAANGDTNWFAPSMGTSKLVQSDPILARAFAEASERGILSQTSISVLTNRNRTPANAYSNIPGAFLRATKIGMSALFNGAERMTREMTYLMTFELEYAKTKDFDKSVQKAIDVVQETLGRYDSFNRPRILRNFLGRTVGQFKMYAVNMTSFFMRNGYNIFSKMFSDPKLAFSAMHRLGGVLTMAALFGGVTALPLYSTVCAVIDMYLDLFGDDEEKKRRIARNPYTAESADLRFRYEFLPEWFGPMRYQTTTGLDGKEHTLASILEKGAVSELTDINVGSRTSFDGMWWRGGKHGDTDREKVENFLIANIGAGAETILKIPEAMTEWKNGNIERGLEKVLPAMLKNVVTEERIRKEGAKTPSGKLIMSKEEFSSFNLAMQSLGFQSTALARVQENGIKLQEEIIVAAEQRANILKRLSTSILSDSATDADIERVFNKIDEYNDRYIALKHLRIEPSTIKEVTDRAKDKEKFMFRGLYIRKEDLPYLLELRDVAEPPQKKK